VIWLALDAWTKWLAVANLERHVPVAILGDIGRFTLGYNPGAAFSMHVGEYSRLIFSVIAVVALGVLWWIHRTSPGANRLRDVALGLAWGGAAGNLLDRLMRGAVVDFIDIGVGTTRFWTFNVADAGITVGAVVLAWVLWREEQAPS
jgi:signal peptidase II